MVDQSGFLKQFYSGDQGAYEMEESIKSAARLLNKNPNNQISPHDLFGEAYKRLAMWPEKGGRLLPVGLRVQQVIYNTMRDVLRQLRPMLRKKRSDGTTRYVSRTKSLGSALDDTPADVVQTEYVDERTGLNCEELISTMADEKALALLRAALAEDIDFTDTKALSAQLNIPLLDVTNTKRRINRWADDIRTDPESEAAKRARALYEALEPAIAKATTGLPPTTTQTASTEHQKSLRKRISDESGDAGAHARGQLDGLSTSDMELVLILLLTDADA